MRKILQRISLVLLVGILMGSCAKSKLNDTVQLLNEMPVFITQDRVDQKVEMADGVIFITIPDQGELTDKEGKAADEAQVVSVFLRGLFNNNISAMVLGKTLGTAEGGTPVDDFLKLVKEQDVKFLIEYKGKKFNLTADQLQEVLKGTDLRNPA